MIDWTDERAIGLKVRVWDSNPDDFMDSLFSGLSNDLLCPYIASTGYWKNIKLLEGEKTEHDGKEQPIPDDVVVRIWIDGIKYTDISQDISWHMQLHYQILREDKETKEMKYTIEVTEYQYEQHEKGEIITVNGKKQWHDKLDGKYIPCWVSGDNPSLSNKDFMALVTYKDGKYKELGQPTVTWEYATPLTVEEQERLIWKGEL